MEELTLLEPESQKSYTIKVTAAEKDQIMNGDYELATKLIDKEKEKENYLAAFEIHRSIINTCAQTSSETCEPEQPEVNDDLLFEHEEGGDLENFKWTQQATKLLLELYFEKKEQFRNPKVKKKGIWTVIKEMFHQRGYIGISEDMLDRKMRNMKKRYRTIKDNNRNKTGRSRITWEYFEVMDNIFIGDKTINFADTLSNLQSSDSCSVSPVSEDIIDDDLNITDASNTPSCSNTINTNEVNSISTSKRKAENGRQLYSLRKQAVQIEEQRVEQLKKLRESIQQSNRIQEQRNEILLQLLSKK